MDKLFALLFCGWRAGRSLHRSQSANKRDTIPGPPLWLIAGVWVFAALMLLAAALVKG